MGKFEIIAGLVLAAILFVVLKVIGSSLAALPLGSGASFSNSLRS